VDDPIGNQLRENAVGRTGVEREEMVKNYLAYLFVERGGFAILSQKEQTSNCPQFMAVRSIQVCGQVSTLAVEVRVNTAEVMHHGTTVPEDFKVAIETVLGDYEPRFKRAAHGGVVAVFSLDGTPVSIYPRQSIEE